MELWVQYALIAALFLSLKNMISKHLSDKYKYIDYLIYAISFSFIGVWLYVFATGYKPGKIEDNDIVIILFRILIKLFEFENKSDFIISKLKLFLISSTFL